MDDSSWRLLLVPSVLACVGQVRNNISRGCNSQHFPFHINSYYFNLFLMCAWLYFYFLSLFRMCYLLRAHFRIFCSRVLISLCCIQLTLDKYFIVASVTVSLWSIHSISHFDFGPGWLAGYG